MEGMLSLWFLLTVLSLIYVSVDLYRFKGPSVIKLGWWFSVLFTGILGILMYVVVNKTRESLKTIPVWKKALGAEAMIFSIMGFGMGLVCLFLNSLFIAKNASFWMLFFEYIFGLGFGFFIYQRLFFHEFVDNLFSSHLNAFIAQFIFINSLASGFFVIQMIWNAYFPESRDIQLIYFWGMLSLSYIVGSLTLFPFVLWQVQKGFVQGSASNNEGNKSFFVLTKEPVVILSSHKLRNKIIWSVIALIVAICIGFFWAKQAMSYEMTSPFYF